MSSSQMYEHPLRLQSLNSPVLTGAPSFSFPPQSHGSQPNAFASSSKRLVEEVLPPPASTARFYEALAGTNASRHKPNDSSSSFDSDKNSPQFRFPPDSASPTGAKSFGLLQRELGGNEQIMGLGFEQPNKNTALFKEKPFDNRFDDYSDNYYDTITPTTDFTGIGAGSRRHFPDLSFENNEAKPFGSREMAATMGLGIGRPASMDMGGGESSYDGDVSFDFPRPYPDPSISSVTRQAIADAQMKAKEREKPRDRTYPVPLLLKGNRPFGGIGSNTPIATTQPLQVGRKFSFSNESTPPTSAAPSPIATFRPLWNAPTSLPPQSHSKPSIDSLIAPGPITAAELRPNPAFRRHKYQNSSNSFNSYASQSYMHSPHPSGSSLSISSSSAIGSTSTLSYNTTEFSSQPTISTTAADPPVAPQALLLYILSLRSASNPMALSQSQGPPSRSTSGLFGEISNHQRIKSAGSTNSENDEEEGGPHSAGLVGKLGTVDLSHKHIAEVPIEVIEELRDEVEKLALGYNLLRDLPMHFNLLGNRLRYLNVRVNMLTIFPQVLCEMPSLEILDISRNKIKKLPSNPGTLINLKVFSIAKNRIKRLPAYVGQMTGLRVLKIDHNPLEWPPKEISTFPLVTLVTSVSGIDGDGRKNGSKVEELEDMNVWLPNVLRWIRENAAPVDRRIRPSISNEHASDEERNQSHGLSSSRHIGMTRTESGRLIVSPAISTASTFVSSGPRPRGSPPSAPTLVNLSHSQSGLPAGPESSPRLHTRNASASTTQNLQSEQRPSLKSKKSLPDLRQSHADILAERWSGPTEEDDRVAVSATVRRVINEETKSSLGSSTNSSRAATPTQASTSMPRPVATRSTPSTRKISSRAPPPITTRNEYETERQSTRTEEDRSTSAFDRNSGAYFRRLSMLPTSTISKTVPVVLLQFAEAIRGILFSLSQVYSALRQFIVFASQDRLPAPLSRLLTEADGGMSSLINALDRFDSVSRRGTPEASIIRDVFVTCHQNVSTFGQLVAALRSHLKALVATADVRYTRTLLLMLYGSMGEIANSWNRVSPTIREMALSTKDRTTLVLQPPTPSPTAELNLSTNSRLGVGGIGTLYRARSKTRRHAGSFSVEDVQLGAVIPPASIPPTVPSSHSETLSISASDSFQSSSQGTIKARPLNKNRSFGPSSILMPPTLQRSDIHNAFDQPTTPGGPAIPTMWSGSNSTEVNGTVDHAPFSFSASNALLSNYPPPPIRSESFSTLPHPEVPRLTTSNSTPSISNATLNADKTFLSMVESTTGIAFEVYALLLESFDPKLLAKSGDEDGLNLIKELGSRKTKELTDLCRSGTDITHKLRFVLKKIRKETTNGILVFTKEDAKKLGDESYAFVQTVIRFAKLVKAISLEHGFAPRVRDGVGQLTIATREFAKHLSNSSTSFRPAVSTRSVSSSNSHA